MKSLKGSHRENLAGVMFVAPALIYVVILVAYPLVYNFQMSFFNLNVLTFKNQNTVFQGINNYISLFRNEIFLGSLYNTFFYTIWCLIFQFTIGFILAILFSKKFIFSNMIHGLILISYMIPLSVTGLLYKNMFSTETGVINYILQLIGIIQESIPWLINSKSAIWSLVIANSWVGIPFNMLLLTAGMTNIPSDLYESASIDGANPFQKFFRITVPLLRSSIVAVLTLGFIYTFKVFDLVFIMTAGGPSNSTHMLSTYAYKLSFAEYNFSMGAASGVILFLCLLIIGFIYLNIMQRAKDY